MIQKVSRKWLEVWGAEQIQNQILKGLLSLMVALCAIETVALCCLALRTPLIIAVTPDKTSTLFVTPGTEALVDQEIRRVVSAYVQAHHTWDWQNVDTQLEQAARLISSEFSSQFKAANAAQAKIAKDKKLSQKLYLSDIAIDPKEKTATITADRILVVEGLRATNPMTLRIQYEMGSRTSSNPEGIYITSEELIPSSSAN